RKLIGLLITAVNAVEGLPISLAQTRHGVNASALALVNIGLDVLALQALSMLQLRDAVPEALDLGLALGIRTRHIGVSHSSSPSLADYLAGGVEKNPAEMRGFVPLKWSSGMAATYRYRAWR